MEDSSYAKLSMLSFSNSFYNPSFKPASLEIYISFLKLKFVSFSKFCLNISRSSTNGFSELRVRARSVYGGIAISLKLKLSPNFIEIS
jgi:hypothetical protein